MAGFIFVQLHNMGKTMLRSIFAASLLFTVCCSANATEIGAVVPEWRGLAGADGKLHSSAEYKDDKFIVVAFFCNKCPCARGYETRFNQFVKDYGTKGVRLIAINSSVGPLEHLGEMKSRASGGKMQFDYLRDENQNVGKSFGAKSTPHVFILDQNRRILYSGAFDDNRSARLVKNHYVIDSIDRLLAGKPLETTTTRFFGCAITYQ